MNAQPAAGQILTGSGTPADPFEWRDSMDPEPVVILTPEEKRRAAHQRAFESEDAHRITRRRKDAEP